MNNARRHNERLPTWCRGIDPFSSAWYFRGWRDDSWRADLGPPEGAQPVAPPHTWLLADGWLLAQCRTCNKPLGRISSGEYPQRCQPCG